MSKYRVKIGIHSFGNLIVRKGDVFELANERFADTEGRERFFEKVLEEKPKTIAQIAEDAKNSSLMQVAEIKKERTFALAQTGVSSPDGVAGETGVDSADKTIRLADVAVPKKNKAGRPKKNAGSK